MQQGCAVPLLISLKTHNWSDLAGDEGGVGGRRGGGGPGEARWGGAADSKKMGALLVTRVGWGGVGGAGQGRGG